MGQQIIGKRKQIKKKTILSSNGTTSDHVKKIIKNLKIT